MSPSSSTTTTAQSPSSADPFNVGFSGEGSHPSCSRQKRCSAILLCLSHNILIILIYMSDTKVREVKLLHALLEPNVRSHDVRKDEDWKSANPLDPKYCSFRRLLAKLDRSTIWSLLVHGKKKAWGGRTGKRKKKKEEEKKRELAYTPTCVELKISPHGGTVRP